MASVVPFQGMDKKSPTFPLLTGDLKGVKTTRNDK